MLSNGGVSTNAGLADKTNDLFLGPTGPWTSLCLVSPFLSFWLDGTDKCQDYEGTHMLKLICSYESPHNPELVSNFKITYEVIGDNLKGSWRQLAR